MAVSGKLRAQLSPDDWERFVDRNPGLQETWDGLKQLRESIFLEPRKERRGPPSNPEIYMLAENVARLTAAALRAAGRQGSISLTSRRGPVACIGVRVFAAIHGWKPRPATFVHWVERSPTYPEFLLAAI